MYIHLIPDGEGGFFVKDITNGVEDLAPLPIVLFGIVLCITGVISAIMINPDAFLPAVFAMILSFVVCIINYNTYPITCFLWGFALISTCRNLYANLIGSKNLSGDIVIFGLIGIIFVFLIALGVLAQIGSAVAMAILLVGTPVVIILSFIFKNIWFYIFRIFSIVAIIATVVFIVKDIKENKENTDNRRMWQANLAAFAGSLVLLLIVSAVSNAMFAGILMLVGYIGIEYGIVAWKKHAIGADGFILSALLLELFWVSDCIKMDMGCELVQWVHSFIVKTGMTGALANIETKIASHSATFFEPLVNGIVWLAFRLFDYAAPHISIHPLIGAFLELLIMILGLGIGDFIYRKRSKEHI